MKPGTNRDKMLMRTISLIIEPDGRRWIAFRKYFGEDGTPLPDCRSHWHTYDGVDHKGLTPNQCERAARAVRTVYVETDEIHFSRYIHGDGWSADWFKSTFFNRK